jgi:death on curing protein
VSFDFLSFDEVLELHADQIKEHGGAPELRDRGALESAVAQPQAAFGGVLLHKDLFEAAAAYAFHICQNHPFVDGNKRVALYAAATFLDLNGFELADPGQALYDMMIAVAEGRFDKKSVADQLQKLSRTLVSVGHGQ